jgi:predicted transcriptional regulator
MSKKLQHGLGKRERQIMEVIYRRKVATAQEVLDEIPDPPGYSTVRSFLTILEEKGFLKHERRGRRYAYSPTISHKSAVRSTLQNVLKTFFNNSVEDAVEALMEVHGKHLNDDDYDKLIKLIEKAKKEGIE